MSNTTLNQVSRFALSDASGVTGFSLTSNVEAGLWGLRLDASSQEVGGICTDYSGNIYVSDVQEHFILKVDEGGNISRFAGLPGTSGNNNDGVGLAKIAAADARFNAPRGLCCDKSNNIYVADSGNNKIRKIDNGGDVTTFAGSMAGASGYTNGVSGAARFNAPRGVAIDNSGILYVADFGNHAVRKVLPNGQVYSLAGDGNDGDAENFLGNDPDRTPNLRATFEDPWDVATDQEGNVYVMDYGNNKIKKITPSGWVYLHSGSGTSGRSLGTTGGNTPATAQAYTCTYGGLVSCDTDNSGNLYVIDRQEGDTRLLTVNYNGEPAEIADFNNTNLVDNPIGVAVSPGQKIFVAMSGYETGLSSSSSSSE